MSAGQLSKQRREALGRMLAWIRVQRGMLTRTALRDASGVSLMTIKNLEEGRTAKPREEVLLQLDDALDLPPQTLTSYAHGSIGPDVIRRIIGERDLPVWIRVPQSHNSQGENTSDLRGVLMEVIRAASIDQLRRVVEAARRIVAGRDDEGP